MYVFKNEKQLNFKEDFKFQNVVWNPAYTSICGFISIMAEQ